MATRKAPPAPKKNKGKALVDSNALDHYDSYSKDSSGAGVQFLKFAKSGSWMFGQTDSVLDPDDLIVVNMGTLAKGYVCWKAKKPVEEVMRLVSKGGSVDEDDLTDHGPYKAEMEGWSETHQVLMALPAEGDTLSYATSSKGGIGAIASLAKTWVTAIKEGEETQTSQPVVSLSGTSYEHATYGETHVPVITVLGYIDEADDITPEALTKMFAKRLAAHLASLEE